MMQWRPNRRQDASENTEGTYSLKILHDEGKFNNSFSYNKTYIERNTTTKEILIILVTEMHLIWELTILI